MSGDDPLKAVRDCLGPYDVFGRYGGEESLLVAPRRPPTAGGGVFERVRRAVEETPVGTAGGVISVTVSIGVAKAV